MKSLPALRLNDDETTICENPCCCKIEKRFSSLVNIYYLNLGCEFMKYEYRELLINKLVFIQPLRLGLYVIQGAEKQSVSSATPEHRAILEEMSH